MQTQKAYPGFSAHNHANCVHKALMSADERCAHQGLRLTPVRRKVLEILLEEHKAMGAYAILDRLRDAGFGSQPPVAYRALEFLSGNGFVHKIEVLNAYVACAHPDASHTPAFMICKVCDAVAEAPSGPVENRLGDEAEAAGFQIERTILEAEGVCPRCVDTATK